MRSVAPDYPEIARQAGVEGDVTLRVVIGKDGTVADVVPISGEPVLARAAMEAVERWHYAPVMVGGRPIGVVTTVTLAFRLR
jgi:protein TonB